MKKNYMKQKNNKFRFVFAIDYSLTINTQQKPAQTSLLKSSNTRVFLVAFQRVHLSHVINMANDFRWAELRSGVFDDVSSHVTVYAARCESYLHLRQQNRSSD